MPLLRPNSSSVYLGAGGKTLLKMHAYRDAIRRTAGAYVLFPGNDSVSPYREFQEVLPGLGAFVLRPASSPSESGRTAIEKFLSDVVDHVADRATQHERDRFWRATVRHTPEPAYFKRHRTSGRGSTPSLAMRSCSAATFEAESTNDQ